MLHEFDHNDWYTWYPREAQKPDFRKETDGRLTYLKILPAGCRHAYGKWCCIVSQIRSGDPYRFRVEYAAENIRSEVVSVSAILTWQDAGGTDLTRNYADEARITGSGWTELSGIFTAPEAACRLRVELVLKWPGSGSVMWRNPQLSTTGTASRQVRVATTYINPYVNLDKTAAGNLERICQAVDEAGRQNADIICLSETIHDRGLDLPLEEKCETLSGPFVQAMSGKAKLYNCYIVFSLHEKDGDYLYNTAILMDRNGEIAGKYRKTHLALCEGEAGIVPGDEYPVFDTDFGKIGMLICWDHYFPEPARIMRLQGAEILFVSTAGDAPAQSLSRAVENGVYMVISGINKARVNHLNLCPSRIINPLGEVVGEVEQEDLGVYVGEIGLNQRLYAYWLSVGAAYGEGRSIYLKERRPDTYDMLASDWVL